MGRMAYTFYRIVRTDPPTERDFLSHHALGRRPVNPTPEVLAHWDGVSVYEREDQARGLARRRPWLGTYLAELRIPDGAPIRIHAWGSKGHYTLWADPGILNSCVTRVVPV